MNPITSSHSTADKSAAASPAAAPQQQQQQSHDLYLGVVATKGIVMGTKTVTFSGLYRASGDDEKTLVHLGGNNPKQDDITCDPRNPSILFAAALNGVLRSRDGGATWRIMTGWDMTEPKCVAIDPNAPDTLYAALPDGIGVSEDAGMTWTRRDSGIRRKYTQWIAADRTAKGRLVAGTELGIFVSNDGARSWKRVLETRATVNNIRQSPHDPELFAAATQSDGAWLSRDGARTWKRIEGVPAAHTLHNIEFDPAGALRLAVCGWEPGVHVSEDGGKTWSDRGAGLPNKQVWRIACDPTRVGRLYAAPHYEAVHVSDDFGRTWRKAFFESVIVWNMTFLPRATPQYTPPPPASIAQPAARPAATTAAPAAAAATAAAATTAAAPAAAAKPPPPPRTSFSPGAPVPRAAPYARDTHRAGYIARAREVTTWRAGLADMDDPASGGFAEIAAKLALREDAGWCSRRLVEILKEPSGDMFWMFPCMAVAYLGRGQLSPAAQRALRDAWRTYMPVRGDTENHWAMYYASLYLAAQLWPGEPGEKWFTGKSSAENLAEARAYLVHWIDLTTARGQGEYNCTHYIGEYMIPMLYLLSWADDPAMRRRGHMMLDYLAADFAINTLDGIYIGSHARTDDRQILEKWNGLSSFFGWLFFNNCPPPEAFGAWGSYFAVVAHNYELPEIIHRIATDRDAPYLEKDLKRTRHRWRNSDVRSAPVYKTTCVTKNYAVGSDQGGLLQPIQQHSWDVTWAVPDPRGVHNTFFTMQPDAGPFELQMYFTEFPDWMPKAVASQGKPTYDIPDKLLGGSPYEQIFQDADTVVALYNIDPGARFCQVNTFISKDLARLERDASGWIFLQGGDTCIAWRPFADGTFQPYRKGSETKAEWKEGGWQFSQETYKDNDMIFVSPHLRNGALVQVAAAAEFAGWDAFKAAILELPVTITRDPVPRVTFTSLRGKKITCAHGEAPVVDGDTIDYAKWKLFEGPYLNADPDSRALTLTHGKLRRVLDFKTLTITDSTTAP
jgi:hypothetical protein